LQAGQQFITLVPADAPLEVEANIDGKDDGRVKVGDPVAIKFATFPYAEFGMAHGVVRLISADSFTSTDEQRNPTGAVPVQQGTMIWYRSRITLDEIGLHNTPPNFHLVPGMPVDVDILIGKQTVLHYMFNRFVPLATEAMREP
jgi:HlyD family secretion protein